MNKKDGQESHLLFSVLNLDQTVFLNGFIFAVFI